MKKIKQIHKTVAIFFIITFLQSLLPYNVLLANNTGPKSPEAAAFEPIDATDMVNLLTGDFSYVLPLLNVPSPEGGYPLALSYHSGIAMGQEASWAGLGWTVNPGAINRTVSGVPDDWKRTKRYKSIFDQGGVSTSYSGTFSLIDVPGFYSLSIYGNYSENKTFGGENSYNFDIGASEFAGYAGFGATRSLGTDGVGVGVGFSYAGVSIGVSAREDFDNGQISYGASISAYSVGISWDSQNGTSLNWAMGSHSLSGSNHIPTGLSFSNSGFSIIGSTSFKYERKRYWLYEMDYTTFNGSLYAGDMQGLKTDSLFLWKIAFDSYEGVYSSNRNSQIDDNNFSHISYDNYSVSGQGLTGFIQPRVFEEGALYNQHATTTIGESGIQNGGAAYYYPSVNANANFNKSLDSNNLFFYFNNESSSYLKVDSGNWNLPSSNIIYDDVFDFNTNDQFLNSEVEINGIVYNGYNSQTKRKRTGSYIEAFKNEDIEVALSGNNYLNFVEAKGINRNQNPDLFPDDGIGGYRITTTDGKTYHYSLPVYQREKFSRTTEIDKDPENQYVEEFEIKPYATHWLLTAITGPDYIDRNENYQVDTDDFGYWVEFEYGKWSDGYSWRNPIDEGFNSNPYTKKYEWGIKDIYYLDKIKTRTHTALFIKQVREDNHSSEISVRNGTEPIVYNDTHLRSYIVGTDGNYYANGVYENVQLTQFPPYYYVITSKHKMYIKTNDHRTLKLSKIILVDNKNPDSDLQKTNDYQENPINAGKIKIDQHFDISYDGVPYDPIDINIVDREWQGEFFGNILDVRDVANNSPNIEDNALKVINFNHEYKLMRYSPNSEAALGSKLTLESVHFKGKGGTQLIPPYNFEYSNNGNYSNELKDDWGYSQNDPREWSLTKIITPVGETLEIEYEEDEYKEEAALTNFVFEDNLVMKFEGNDIQKKVSFKNNPDNLPEQDIDFTDYFELGESSRVNVQYIYDPDSNAEERVADVDKICEVLNVSETMVTFELPLTSESIYERSQSICNQDNWVAYHWYSDPGNESSVVQRTANWVSQHREYSCDEVHGGEHRTRIQVYSNKKANSYVGGGIRVKELRLRNDGNLKYYTTYNYNDPVTNVTSGVTSYAPSKIQKEVKYLSELPTPTVMYEYVTVVNKDSNEQAYSKDTYHFNVLKPMVETSTGFEMDDLLSLERLQDFMGDNTKINSTDPTPLKLTRFNLINNLASVGRLISKKSFNKDNQLISQVNNEYLSLSEIKQGITKETFKTYKKVFSEYHNGRYYFNSSAKTTYPNVLRSITKINSGNNFIASYGLQDFLTGNFLETESQSSDGNLYRTLSIPAYHKYSKMGTKADDDHNRNMLSQEAINYQFIKESTSWKPIGVGIQTWNNEWSYKDIGGNESIPYDDFQKIWRKHKTYVWDGEIDANGIYVNYDTQNDDGFNWQVNPLPPTQPDPWKQVSEITQYDHFSRSLEVRDVNNNFASSKTWDNDTKIVATANVAHGEIFYSSAEVKEVKNNTTYYGQQITSNADWSMEKSHTGNYSLSVSPGEYAYKVMMPLGSFRPGKYKLSIWVHKDNFQAVRVDHNNAVSGLNGENVVAGSWIQMNHYLDLSNIQQNISIRSANGIIYLDDFRLQPIASSMTSYVYNEFNELTFILGTNNLGTKYQYDSVGRLIKIYEETSDAPTISGGFKLAKEYRYNYKRGDETGGGGDCDSSVYLTDFQYDDYTSPSEAKVVFGTAGTSVTYKITTIRDGAVGIVRGVFQIGSDNWEINLGTTGLEHSENHTSSIPPSGILELSAQHFNHPRDSLGISSIYLLSVDPPTICIDNPRELTDISKAN